jgi:hypothetical protein
MSSQSFPERDALNLAAHRTETNEGNQHKLRCFDLRRDRGFEQVSNRLVASQIVVVIKSQVKVELNRIECIRMSPSLVAWTSTCLRSSLDNGKHTMVDWAGAN